MTSREYRYNKRRRESRFLVRILTEAIRIEIDKMIVEDLIEYARKHPTLEEKNEFVEVFKNVQKNKCLSGETGQTR